MNDELGTPIAGLRDTADPSGLAQFPTTDEEQQMKLTRAARTILSITALAWAIPLAQADDKEEPRAGTVRVIQLDAVAERDRSAWPSPEDPSGPSRT